LEQWARPEVCEADFIFFNNSSGWFNNSKALVRFWVFPSFSLVVFLFSP